MKSIEKELYATMNGSIAPLSRGQVYTLALEQGDDFVDALFSVLKTTLNEYTGQQSLDRLKRIFEYLNITIENAPQVSRKIVERKLKKLSEQLDRIEVENKLLENIKAQKQLAILRKELDAVVITNSSKESKQTEFIEYLIKETRNLSYLTKTFEKMPSLIHVKDKAENTLLTKVIKTYLEKTEDPETNKEDLLYYNNVISILMDQNPFEKDISERRKNLDVIYCHLDQITKRKNRDGQTKERCYWIENMKEIIQREDTKKFDIEKLGAKYKIPISFEESLLEELKLYETEITNETYPGRVLIDDYILSMDDKYTKQIDDGLSCKKMKNGNYLLGVHTTSVLGYIPYESPIIQEALNRGFAIYLPKSYQMEDGTYNKLIPTLPLSFTTAQGSLLENQERLARSYYFEIDREGEVVNQKFLKTRIKNKKKNVI